MIFSIFAVGLLVSSANAFWRLPCAKPVLDARADPIVTSGKPSSHAHTIMGSNGALITYLCSTAIKQNLIAISSHWIQYFFYGPTKFPVFDLQGQGRQISILDSRNGS